MGPLPRSFLINQFGRYNILKSSIYMSGKNVCLICIDGWGILPPSPGNAITSANPPVMNGFRDNAIWMPIEASGLAVGLPKGLMGNSEVGHLTIGAGRRQYQDLVKINLSIEESKFTSNPVLVDAFNVAKSGSGRVHFLGLGSDGGVHSHLDHLKEFVTAAKNASIPSTYVHFFGDGRDTPPNSGAGYLKDFTTFLADLKYGSLADVVGRYWAMDRDKRWDRMKIAYDMLVNRVGPTSTNVLETVKERYAAGENDEFLKPIILDTEGGIRSGDVCIFINFRSDRMRQLVEVLGFGHTGGDKLGNDSWPPFEISGPAPHIHPYQMTCYDEKFPFPILFPKESMDNVLAEWLSKQGVPQYHSAETEKYAHMTFFFNGGKEEPFDLETRAMVPSPKVATYDLAPEMNAAGVAEDVVKALATKKWPFVVCNFAPPDMVGHTGNLEAAIKAITACDAAIGEIWKGCQDQGYVLVITSDHGNAEVMIAEDGTRHTAHTSSPVPLVIAGDIGSLKVQRSTGELSDVAPTILKLMQIPIPAEMTGKSLLA